MGSESVTVTLDTLRLAVILGGATVASLMGAHIVLMLVVTATVTAVTIGLHEATH
jgi:hypothetical protein